jgi:putative ABC transport system permease protein
VSIEIAGRRVRTRVGVVVGPDQFGALAETPIAVVPLAYGQELAGLEGRVSRVYVLARPGREEAVEALLRRVAAGRADVRPADFDARVFAQAALPNDQSTGLFAFISACVGFLFAFNALLLVAEQRRALIAVLRSWGFSRRSVVQILVVDALVLGVVASTIGLLLGEILSHSVFPPSPGYLALAFPVGVGRAVPWHVVVIAFGSGIVAAVGATLVPLRKQFSRERASARDGAVARFFTSRGAVVGGAASFALATVVLFAAPGAAVVGVLALLVAMLLWLPWVLAGVLALGERLQYRSGSALLLGLGALRAGRIRSSAIAAIAGIALLGSVAVEGSHRDLQHGLDSDVHELTSVSNLWVTAAGSSNALATTPFGLDAVHAIDRLPQVAAVDVQRGGFLDIGDRRVWVLAPPRDALEQVPPSQIIAGDPKEATARLREHGWAAVSEALADEQHLRLGHTFTLASPRPTQLRLAAVISNLGWTPGTIVVNADDYRQAWGTSDASALRVKLAPTVAPAIGKRRVEEALGPRSGLTVETAAEREQHQRATAREGLARLTQIAALVLGGATLAMAAAMGAMVWQRRPALARAKLLGISTRHLWHALLIESAVLLGIGCTIGAAFGLYGAQLLDRTLTSVTGFPVQSSLALPVALLAYGLLAAFAFALAALFSRLAAKIPARTAFQD